MMFQPTDKTTGRQVSSSGQPARSAVVTAHAVCDEGDFEFDKYEERYGSVVQCSPSHMNGLCIWSIGNWQMYEVIESLA